MTSQPATARPWISPPTIRIGSERYIRDDLHEAAIELTTSHITDRNTRHAARYAASNLTVDYPRYTERTITRDDLTNYTRKA